MQVRRIGSVLVPLLACLLISASSGCCLRKGFILKGDWSLELNRLPHLAGHGDKYECESAACGDGGPGAAPGMYDPASQANGQAANAQGAGTQHFLPIPTRPAFRPWETEGTSPVENERTEAPPSSDGMNDVEVPPEPPEPAETSEPADKRHDAQARMRPISTRKTQRATWVAKGSKMEFRDSRCPTSPNCSRSSCRRPRR